VREEALQLGVISTSMYEKYEYYKLFLELTSKGEKQMDAIFNIAEASKCSVSTVFRAVSFFRN
jgi:hypothetical protein